MKVREAMTRDVRLVKPDQAIREAACLMAQLDIGALPVEQGERLVGMIPDRDIAVRAVAQNLGPDTPVSEIMTAEVNYCFEDHSIDEVTQHMGELRIRRLPVLDRDKRLVGILSLGDLAIDESARVEASEALGGISRPGDCTPNPSRALRGYSSASMSPASASGLVMGANRPTTSPPRSTRNFVRLRDIIRF